MSSGGHLFCPERGREEGTPVEANRMEERPCEALQRKERLDWVDAAKGFAILIMLLGHCEVGGLLRTAIFSFHMPLFIVTNGYFIKRYDSRSAFRKSCKSLLLPYCVTCLLSAVLYAFVKRESLPVAEALGVKLKAMVGGVSYTSTLFQDYGSVCVVWFVCCLFVARNLYILLRELLQNRPRWLQNLLFCGLAFVGYYVGCCYAYLPWSADVALVAMLFLMLGEHLAKSRFFDRRLPVILLVSGLVWGLSLLTGQHIELATRVYPWFPLCLVQAAAGSVFCLGVFKALARFRLLTRILCWYGRNSMVLLAVHCLELLYFPWERLIYARLPFRVNVWVEFALRLLGVTAAAALYLWAKGAMGRLGEALEARTPPEGAGRDGWADIAKGIAMVSVILGHLGLGYLNQVVYTYHLPVFFLLAGYYQKKKDSRTLALSRGRALLAPYAFTCALICCGSVAVNLLMGYGGKKADFFAWVGAALYGAGDSWEEPVAVRGIGAIWFLLALFFASLIVNCFAGKRYAPLCIGVIAYGGWATMAYSGVWLPLSIQAGCLAALYVYLGLRAREEGLLERDPGWAVKLAALGVWLWGVLNFKGIWLVHNELGNGLMDVLVTLCASYGVILLARWLERTSRVWKHILLFFGRNSLIILCFHIVELNLAPWKELRLPLEQSFGFTHDEAMLVTVPLKLLWCALAVAAVNRIPPLRRVFHPQRH